MFNQIGVVISVAGHASSIPSKGFSLVTSVSRAMSHKTLQDNLRIILIAVRNLQKSGVSMQNSEGALTYCELEFPNTISQ